MAWFFDLFQAFLHVDVCLSRLIAQFGGWSYVLLGTIIFVETGIVIAPFLPGDSLMFAAGAFASRDALDIRVLFPLFVIAAIIGDTANYLSGRWCRSLIAQNRELRWIRRDYLEQTQAFYAKHGAKMIIIARFVPVLRSFAPFVGGLADMKYATFLTVNVIGGFLWVSLFLWGGYFFGSIPFVEERFSSFVVGVVLLSLVPLLLEAIQRKRKRS